MLRSVSSVLGDPGGAEAVAPVLSQLADRRALGRVFASKAATPVLDRLGLPRSLVQGPIDQAVALELLTAADPSVLIASTSWGANRPEPGFIAAARQLGIPTLSLVDFWSNYRERFVGNDRDDLLIPDRIAVMDDRARVEAIESGLPGDVVVVTGNPHHEALVARFASWNRDARTSFRESMRIPRNATVVLFASQPIEALYGRGLGYTEGQVSRLVAEALVPVAEWLGHPVHLVVRPHPRGGQIDLPPGTDQVTIRVTGEGNPVHWCLASDLVVGMSSALLFDTALLGGRVVSVQPGLIGPDALPSNRIGLSDVVYQAGEIAQVLYRALARPAQAGPAQVLTGLRAAAHGAADRVVEQLDAMSLTGASA